MLRSYAPPGDRLFGATGGKGQAAIVYPIRRLRKCSLGLRANNHDLGLFLLCQIGLECRVAMVQNQWYHFGIGAPPITVYFSENWVFTGGTGF